MCQVTSNKKQALALHHSLPSSDGDYDILADVPKSSKVGWWRPLHPLVVLAVLPLLPTWLFLNRGFTQWFHWGFVLYMVTGQRDTWRRFLVLQGGAVMAGWYASVAHEYWTHGRFCHLLYNNMPGAMKQLMLVNGRLASGGLMTDNALGVAALGLAHFFDFLAHPYLTYAIWKMHTSRGGTLRTLVSTEILVATYIWSRIYSMTHIYYNSGAIGGLFYYGYDVYKIDNLDAYTAAYVGEALFYVGLIGYKMWFKLGKYLRLNVRLGRRRRRRVSRKSIPPKQLSMLCVEDKQKPNLIKSDSCFSESEASLPADE